MDSLRSVKLPPVVTAFVSKVYTEGCKHLPKTPLAICLSVIGALGLFLAARYYSTTHVSQKDAPLETPKRRHSFTQGTPAKDGSPKLKTPLTNPASNEIKPVVLSPAEIPGSAVVITPPSTPHQSYEEAFDLLVSEMDSRDKSRMADLLDERPQEDRINFMADLQAFFLSGMDGFQKLCIASTCVTLDAQLRKDRTTLFTTLFSHNVDPEEAERLDSEERMLIAQTIILLDPQSINFIQEHLNRTQGIVLPACFVTTIATVVDFEEALDVVQEDVTSLSKALQTIGWDGIQSISNIKIAIEENNKKRTAEEDKLAMSPKLINLLLEDLKNEDVKNHDCKALCVHVSQAMVKAIDQKGKNVGSLSSMYIQLRGEKAQYFAQVPGRSVSKKFGAYLLSPIQGSPSTTVAQRSQTP